MVLRIAGRRVSGRRVTLPFQRPIAFQERLTGALADENAIQMLSTDTQ